MKCIYCLTGEGNTRDHIIPDSWFPSDTPNSIQRYTVPSCLSCNNKLGKAEQVVFQYLGLTLSEERGEKTGVRKKVFASFGIVNNIVEDEKLKRQAVLKRILSRAQPMVDKKLLFPLKFQEVNNQKMVLPVPMDDLFMVCTKIAKGLEYKLNNKRYVEAPFKAKVLHGEMFNIDLTKDPDGLLKTINFGPEFEVHRVINPGGTEIFYRIKIFDQYIFYVLITDNDNGGNDVAINDRIIQIL